MEEVQACQLLDARDATWTDRHTHTHTDHERTRKTYKHVQRLHTEVIAAFKDKCLTPMDAEARPLKNL